MYHHLYHQPYQVTRSKYFQVIPADRQRATNCTRLNGWNRPEMDNRICLQSRWRFNLDGDLNDKKHTCRALRCGIGLRYRWSGYSVLQASILGTANGEHRHCPGICSLLSEIPTETVSCSPHRLRQAPTGCERMIWPIYDYPGPAKVDALSYESSFFRIYPITYCIDICLFMRC